MKQLLIILLAVFSFSNPAKAVNESQVIDEIYKALEYIDSNYTLNANHANTMEYIDNNGDATVANVVLLLAGEPLPASATPVNQPEVNTNVSVGTPPDCENEPGQYICVWFKNSNFGWKIPSNQSYLNSNYITIHEANKSYTLNWYMWGKQYPAVGSEEDYTLNVTVDWEANTMTLNLNGGYYNETTDVVDIIDGSQSKTLNKWASEKEDWLTNYPWTQEIDGVDLDLDAIGHVEGYYEIGDDNDFHRYSVKMGDGGHVIKFTQTNPKYQKHTECLVLYTSDSLSGNFTTWKDLDNVYQLSDDCRDGGDISQGAQGRYRVYHEDGTWTNLMDTEYYEYDL